MRRLFSGLLLLVVAIGNRQPAHGDVMAHARVDWNAALVTLDDLSGNTDVPTLTWTSTDGFVYVDSVTSYPYDGQHFSDEASDFSSRLSVSASTTHAQCSALRDSSTMSADAASQPGVSPLPRVWNYAYGLSQSWGSFQLTGHGRAVFTVPWEISVFGTAGNWDDYSYAYMFVYLWCSEENIAKNEEELFSADAGDAIRTGTFSFEVLNPGLGDTVIGFFSTDAVAEAESVNRQVPEPSSCVLMGIGLCLPCCACCRRRHKSGSGTCCQAGLAC